MKKFILAFLIMFLCFPGIFAQWEISGGMGINISNTSSVEDYINDAGFAFGGDKMKAFNTSVSFFLELDYELSPKYQLGLEFNTTKFSYTNSLAYSKYEFNYTFYKPSVMFYYVIPGKGYKFKFGGGIGYRFADVDEKNILITNFTASGFGLVAKAVGNTSLGGGLYAYIGADLRYDMTGAIENDNYKIINQTTGEDVELNNLSVGIQLGITYYIY